MSVGSGMPIRSSLPIQHPLFLGGTRLLRLGSRPHIHGPELVNQPVVVARVRREEELREDVRRPPRVDA